MSEEKTGNNMDSDISSEQNKQVRLVTLCWCICMHMEYPYVICTYLDSNTKEASATNLIIDFSGRTAKHHFISWTVGQTKHAI